VFFVYVYAQFSRCSLLRTFYYHYRIQKVKIYRKLFLLLTSLWIKINFFLISSFFPQFLIIIFLLTLSYSRSQNHYSLYLYEQKSASFNILLFIINLSKLLNGGILVFLETIESKVNLSQI